MNYWALGFHVRYHANNTACPLANCTQPAGWYKWLSHGCQPANPFSAVIYNATHTRCRRYIWYTRYTPPTVPIVISVVVWQLPPVSDFIRIIGKADSRSETFGRLRQMGSDYNKEYSNRSNGTELPIPCQYISNSVVQSRLASSRNSGRYLSCAQRTFQRKDFGLIITVKMKTRLQRDSLAMNFRRSVIIAGLWRPEVARLGTFVTNFLRFF